MISNLRAYREMCHYSQGELGTLTGTTRETINRLENGKHIPRLDLAYRIAQVISEKYRYEVRVDDIWEPQEPEKDNGTTPTDN